MPFNPVTGQWESEVLPNPPAPPPMPQQTPYNPDPQDAIERVRLAQDLRAQGLDTPSIKPNIRPDKGINIGRRNLVKGSTMEAIRPYLALLYKQVAKEPLGDQPHQRALGIAARIGVGGYLGAQRAREASNAEAVKSAEELQKERRSYIGTRASELAKHRWEMQREAAKPPTAVKRMIPVTPELRERARKNGLYIDDALTEVDAADLTKAIPDPSLVARRDAMTERDNERLSPETRNFWAQVAAGGGDVPAFILRGMSTQDKDEFTKETARLSGSGYNMNVAKASYRAASGSLGNLTRMANNAKAYSNLIDKNIGVLEPLLGQIKDTNSKWTNGPARALASGLGSKAQAQFDFAVQSLSPEITRLLQSPNLTGVLTVEAQRDMKAVLDKNYTIPQLEGVLQIVKLDKQNRIDTYDEAIKEATMNLHGPGGGVGGVPNPVPAPTDTMGQPKPNFLTAPIKGAVKRGGGR